MRAFEQRQLTARVLAALESRVKQFRRREELWPIRIPVEPIALDDVIEEALGDDSRRFDAGTLRSRTLLQLEWDTEARWDAWVVALPSKTKLYCDSDGEETRLLASGGRNEGDENDRVFLQTLAETGGQAFGIETSGDATHACSLVDHRPRFSRRVFREPVRGHRDGGISPGGHPGRVASVG